MTREHTFRTCFRTILLEFYRKYSYQLELSFHSIHEQEFILKTNLLDFHDTLHFIAFFFFPFLSFFFSSLISLSSFFSIFLSTRVFLFFFPLFSTYLFPSIFFISYRMNKVMNQNTHHGCLPGITFHAILCC